MAQRSDDGGGRPGVETRDGSARTPGGRWAAVALCVLVLQIAFVASCVGALRNRDAHRIPLAVTVPSTRVGDDAFYRLALLPGEPVDPRRVASEAAARRQILDRDVDGALILDPDGTADVLLVAGGAGPELARELAAYVRAAERTQGRTVRVRDIVPGAPGDPRSLASFSLVVGWCGGGLLLGALSAPARGRSGRFRGPLARLAGLALYALVAGLLGALVAGPVLDALPGSVWALWGLGSLLVLAAAAGALALREAAGEAGIAVAVLLIVVLGLPSAGGMFPHPLLPGFWRTVGPLLPPGAGLEGVRSVVYFDGNGAGGTLRVLGAWVVCGAALTLFCAALRGSPRPHARAGDSGSESP
ncbi:DUF3533 domain-containing protein [Streptomyces sp. NA04227]|uniref:ABC transporter permease n=1 Tax=Streptomyces sp. NA04227 TaxID=2742136 RepID=UPI00158FE3E2|nr:ABC transporter permease [Streptomyces sp. NA04227]QKW10289.1 DUF3533 domain-containing protein [Streptomyces sp. NA04227]